MKARVDDSMIRGEVAPGFEEIEAEFRKNFAERGELGAACAIYHRGEKVVDLWGGYRNYGTHAPWEEDTLILVYSTTKGIAAMTMAVAHSRGLIDYDERAAIYWPEFAQQDKENIAVRQLLAHQAGLCAIDEPLDLGKMADHDALAEILARQRPAWAPGTKHGYHYLSLGWCQSELIRRVDPEHRSLGRFFQEEIAKPLGLEFYIGLPPEVPDSRIAAIEGIRPLDLLLHLNEMPLKFVLAFLNPRSLTARTLRNPKLFSKDNTNLNRRDVLSLEIPSGNGIGQVRSIAKAYSVFATGGSSELTLKKETLEELFKPAVPPPAGLHDEVLLRDVAYSLGFIKPFPDDKPANARAFGIGGAGGSLGFADPDAQVGYAYAMTKLGFNIFNDPREKALRDALYRCLHRH